MTDEQFEQRLAVRLGAIADGGVRPFDAVEIARLAMAGSGRRLAVEARRGLPAWFRSLALAAMLVVILVAAAFAGGFIRLPSPIVSPSPTATVVPVSPSPSATIDPSASVDPSVSPSLSPSPSVSPSPSPSPTSSASPSPTPTATPTPRTGWREIDFPGRVNQIELNDVAYRDGIYVAVGYVSTSQPAEGIDGRAWYSTDGQTWTRAANAPGLTPNVVVATDTGFYALNPGGPQIETWRSTDGTSWTLIGASAVLGQSFVNDIAYANGVMVAVGSDENFEEAMVWTSADGVTWTSIAAPNATSELTRVAVRGGDIVVIGDDFTGYGRRIFVRRDHSVGWDEVVPFGEDVDGRLLDLATNGGRFVAVGYEDDFAGGDRLATVRTSVDLTSWTRAVVDNEDRNLVFDQVVTLPDFRFLAIASQGQFSVGECQPDPCVFFDETASAYLSSDGVSWQRDGQVYERHEEGPDEVGDMIEHPRVVAAGAGGVVVFDRWYTALHVFHAPLDTFVE